MTNSRNLLPRALNSLLMSALELKQQYGMRGVDLDVKHAFNKTYDAIDALVQARKYLQNAIDVIDLYVLEEKKQMENQWKEHGIKVEIVEEEEEEEQKEEPAISEHHEEEEEEEEEHNEEEEIVGLKPVEEEEEEEEHNEEEESLEKGRKLNFSFLIKKLKDKVKNGKRIAQYDRRKYLKYRRVYDKALQEIEKLQKLYPQIKWDERITSSITFDTKDQAELKQKLKFARIQIRAIKDNEIPKGDSHSSVRFLFSQVQKMIDMI